MALYPHALDLIRKNLEVAALGQKPKVIQIGTLNPDWLLAINAQRAENDLEPIVDEILFDGRHLYQSRFSLDGYSIEDVLLFVASAFSLTAKVVPGWSTILRNQQARVDRNGKTVHDEAIFECHARHPRPELRTVIPRGDGKDHTQREKATG